MEINSIMHCKSLIISSGLVNTFLSWTFFIPLSRLTYISYLIHPMVLYYFQYNAHQMLYVNDSNVVGIQDLDTASCFSFQLQVLYAGGVTFYTIALSFIITLIFEVPFQALEKAIIPPAKPTNTE
jgi:peptidoglycan/LPS O-acetylase OafA/YrhL